MAIREFVGLAGLYGPRSRRQRPPQVEEILDSLMLTISVPIGDLPHDCTSRLPYPSG
jgi:hypothetical protein